jgi:aspartate 1-decarboxylase
MLRTFVGAKIHGIRVTGKSVHYTGSVSISRALMEAASIVPYERVDVVNLNNGARWTTYALEAGEGEFTLNGGGARLGEIGDPCVVMTYVTVDGRFPGANVVFCDARNRIDSRLHYGPTSH